MSLITSLVQIKKETSMKTRNASLPMTASISVLLLFSALAAQGQAQWLVSNQNLNGTRNQSAEHTITRATCTPLPQSGYLQLAQPATIFLRHRPCTRTPSTFPMLM